MSSKVVKKKEPITITQPEIFDLEQQFILRLPPESASQLHEDLKETSTVQLKDKLSIEMEPDMRHGKVRYGSEIFFAKLLDLPTIIESMKTVDKKTFYKTADICQMLVCKTEEEWSKDDTEPPRKKDKDKKFVLNHGLTAPLKNVRKRRFRKTLKKKYMDQPEVEKEVRRLFRYDSEAIDVKYEIIVDDEKSLSDSGTSQALDPMASGSQIHRTETSTSLDVASFFGELSSSEEEEEDEKDINIMDSGEDDASRGPTTPKGAAGGAAGERGGEVPESGMTDTETAELQEKYAELERQLEEIRERRSHEEDQLATLDDDAAEKGEMQENLNKIVQEESEKEREIEILSAMLSQ
ncbi:transcription initiation factor tfiid subunit [Plakobranchus ocellatus]|uniref:Transcription initiation factor tfiid subunit n=1 Tax=Plakobranchus ocellatus TaxID=259542 RepID=A0AAV3YGJ6_9GAST|nr:transcription initiation factor tfiid subunit [Plakobranchus ocellatus]